MTDARWAFQNIKEIKVGPNKRQHQPNKHLNCLSYSEVWPPLQFMILSRPPVVVIHKRMNAGVHHSKDDGQLIVFSEAIPAKKQHRGVMVPMEEYDGALSESKPKSVS